MTDILDWISRNPGAAFCLGVFLLVLAAITADFFVKLVRSVTGHYPQQYDDGACYCCRERGCDDGCRCCDEDEEEEQDGA